MYRHANIRVQTSADSGVGGEQALVESLELSQGIFNAVEESMKEALNAWPERKASLEAKKAAVMAEHKKEADERAAMMQLWVSKQDKEEIDRELEIKLFGHVVSDRKGEAKTRE